MLLFTHYVMSSSFRPHRLQHTRLPCPSLSPRLGSNSCSLSQWCQSNHSILCCQCISGGQSIGVSALVSVLPMSIQCWLPFRLTDLILQSKILSRVCSSTIIQRHQFFGTQPSLWSNSHPHMTIGKTKALTRWIFVGKVMSLILNMLSKSVITFLPRSKCLLIS